MKYHFKVHKEKANGFWAEGIELRECRSQGDTLDDLKDNLKEALELFLSEPAHSKLIFPMPRRAKIKKGTLAIEVNAKVAFAVTLRNLRLKEGLTQSQMAKKLAIKNLSQYQRLEDPRRANPELLTLKRIKTSFPQLKIDEILAA